MAEFMRDFVVISAMVLLASGLWVLDLVKRDSRGLSAKLSAWVVILAGIGAGVCASSYMWVFRSAGDFDRAYPPALLQVHDMAMMKKMMETMMSNGTTSPPAAPAAPDDHSAHHPAPPPSSGSK